VSIEVQHPRKLDSRSGPAGVVLDDPRVGLGFKFLVHSNYGNSIRLCCGSGTEHAFALWQRAVGSGWVAALGGIVNASPTYSFIGISGIHYLGWFGQSMNGPVRFASSIP
jgi:hypothetical protein